MERENGGCLQSWPHLATDTQLGQRRLLVLILQVTVTVSRRTSESFFFTKFKFRKIKGETAMENKKLKEEEKTDGHTFLKAILF